MADKPHRVQLSRALGWRMPPNTLKVARPTCWGNPYKIGKVGPAGAKDAAEAVAKFRTQLLEYGPDIEALRTELRGKNLACWCALDQPCHADVLLEIANQ